MERTQALSGFEGVVYRGLGGVKPLWDEPNITEGRFHHRRPLRGAPLPGCRPTQYLALHPLGPLAEQLRHAGAREEDAARGLRRNVFAMRVRVSGVLAVDFDSAQRTGIDPAALVGDLESYPACRAWVDDLLGGAEAPAALRVPSAALPGTENLVLFGVRYEYPYDREPRRPQDVPCSVVAMQGVSTAGLTRRVHHLGTGEHPALAAWRARLPYRFEQPPASVPR